jgi:molybdopterin molybdotransferase
MQKPFLHVHALSEAKELLRTFSALDAENVGIDDALFRVLAWPAHAQEDLPSFNRSTMDGFALRSMDTFGATESMPGLLSIIGEVSMGEISGFSLKRGQAVRIWTGGALPDHSDAVAMIEHCEQADEVTLEVLKAVAPFENVVRKGEDFRAGETLIEKGRRLRPQDLGLLAAMGIGTVKVFRRPKIAVISSGDEIVPVEQTPPPGCIRDINRHALIAAIREAHAEPVWIGIAPDRLKDLSAILEKSLSTTDLVLISGGSSMGSRDLVIDAVKSYSEAHILLHGVSISPGKPLIVARIGSTPVVGLPGHPVSAMVCFEHVVVPLLRRLEGEDLLAPFGRPTVRALLSRNVPSREGRLDFVRVRLQRDGGALTAVPVIAKSGMISGLVRAHGAIVIEADCEGLYKGDSVTVSLFTEWREEYDEKEHFPGHEAPSGGPGDLFGPSGPERLSRVGKRPRH